MSIILIKDVPEKVRNDFKAICYRQGQTMKAKLIEYMRKAAEEDK
jgi:hypothetical protein